MNVSLDATFSTPVLPMSTTPWWRVGIAWAVIGITVAVALAGIAMVRVARAGADTAIAPVAGRELPLSPNARSTAPAMQGRNHVASPRP